MVLTNVGTSDLLIFIKKIVLDFPENAEELSVKINESLKNNMNFTEFLEHMTSQFL